MWAECRRLPRTQTDISGLGTSSGLVRFDGFQFVAWGAHGEPGLLSDQVRALLVDSTGALWVGLCSGGVTRIVRREVVHFTARDHLVCVQALLQDRRGTIWAGARTAWHGYAEIAGSFCTVNTDCRKWQCEPSWRIAAGISGSARPLVFSEVWPTQTGSSRFPQGRFYRSAKMAMEPSG